MSNHYALSIMSLFFYSSYKNRNVSVDIICLQETWCTVRLNYSHLDLPGYSCVSKYATCGDKGGVAIYISDHLSVDILDPPRHSDSIWENVFIRVKGFVSNKSIIISNIYRPPRNTAESEHF